MSDHGDYFANHQRARRFPWALYHRPLENDLARFLGEVARRQPRAHVLVIGCGLMHELDRAPSSLRYTVADIDPRAVDAVLALGDRRVVDGVVVAPETPLDGLGRAFDAAYAKEVVEHVVAYDAWLAGLCRTLHPGGLVWLSTPNYGEPWLPALERTVLEAVARRSGFTRRGLHPSRFSRRSLARALGQAGFDHVRVRPTLHRLALMAWAERPG
jgi:2-polyprenyl-3-methyl-5-hydroxy-6-metoxy-1,4-benzoquinol methylase